MIFVFYLGHVLDSALELNVLVVGALVAHVRDCLEAGDVVDAASHVVQTLLVLVSDEASAIAPVRLHLLDLLGQALILRLERLGLADESRHARVQLVQLVLLGMRLVHEGADLLLDVLTGTGAARVRARALATLRHHQIRRGLGLLGESDAALDCAHCHSGGHCGFVCVCACVFVDLLEFLLVLFFLNYIYIFFFNCTIQI